MYCGFGSLMQRMVTIPAINRKVTLAAYINAVKMARDNPDTEFSCGFTTWWPTTGREVMRQFMDSVHDRINQAVPYTQRGL